MKAKLIKPNAKYKNTYIEAIEQFHLENFLNDKININELKMNFEEYLKKIENWENKIDLPDNFSPQSEFWLIHNEEYIGTIKIRHNLGNRILKELGGHIGYFIRPSKRKMGYGKIILRLGLVKAKELNLNEVLITCDINNIGSKKIIESNGGVFEKNVVNNDSDGGFRSRYFINLM
ncbi:MAG TPA: GNAT family N-acetyltransferase [Saprospiraceae bacterium]|nr:GNAT family N-acetyltransferase [Saprospiraceae bacterium]